MGSQGDYYHLQSDRSQQQYSQRAEGSLHQYSQPPSPYRDAYGTSSGGAAGADPYHDQQPSSGGYFSPVPDPPIGVGGPGGQYGGPHVDTSAANAYLGGNGGTAQYYYSPAASHVDLTAGRAGASAWDANQSSPLGSNFAMKQYSDSAWASPSLSKHYGDGREPRALGQRKKTSKKKTLIWLSAVILVLCLAGGAVALVYKHILKKSHPGPGQAIAPDGKLVATTGGNGSVIDLGNGTSFIYLNNHGGFWVSDPLNNTAQAQSYTPPLSEEFDFVKNRILGVNIGSWLVTEPFLAPALYEPYENDTNGIPYTGNKITGDEYSLCTKWIQEGGGGAAGKQYAYNKMKAHYDTYITEQDFAEIAGAGLNWVRLPIGFWAVETYSDEPFVEGLSWQYFLKAVQWARKYGLRINLDLHAVPGSQNGYNHSGKLGNINWLVGPMGYANAQRTLNIIRTITEFISQPEIQPVVPMFSVLNEPLSYGDMTLDNLQSFMGEVYTTVRNITGYGKGNGPIITMHDGFQGFGPWANFMQEADRVFYDDHSYFCFGNSAPIFGTWEDTLPKPCGYFAGQFDQALAKNGVVMAGEWSLALPDCSLWLNNVGQGARYDGTYLSPDGTPDPDFPKYGECGPWDDWWTYNTTMKKNLNTFALAQMESFKNWFFWNWKTGVTGRTGLPANPLWSYQLGIQEGWMPKNPNSDPKGACKSIASSLGVTIAATTQWKTKFDDWMTGGAGSYPATPTAQWPPATIGGVHGALTDLPSYTATGSIRTMPPLTATISVEGASSPNFGSGWFNDSDDAGWFTPLAACNYPSDAYTMSAFKLDANWPCSAAGAKRSAVIQATPLPEAKMTKAERLRRAPQPTPLPIAPIA